MEMKRMATFVNVVEHDLDDLSLLEDVDVGAFSVHGGILSICSCRQSREDRGDLLRDVGRLGQRSPSYSSAIGNASEISSSPGADRVVIELRVECNDLVRCSEDLLPIICDEAHVIKGIREGGLPDRRWSCVARVVLQYSVIVHVQSAGFCQRDESSLVPEILRWNIIEHFWIEGCDEGIVLLVRVGQACDNHVVSLGCRDLNSVCGCSDD